MKAVVTAGGRVGGEYARQAGTPVKALASVRGATMLARIVAALREAGATRIAVIGGPEVRAACAERVERIVEDAGSGSKNLLGALAAWSDDDGEPLLYATSDLPYVTGDAVRDFAARVPAGSLAIALAEQTPFAQRFPGAPPFGIALAGERVVNGGLFSIPAGACARLGSIATAFFDARKRPWKMAGLVGPSALLRFALGRLSVGDLEAVCAEAIGVPAAAVRGCAPELGYDADTLDEYRYACRHA